MSTGSSFLNRTAGYSTIELFQTLDWDIATNILLNDEGPYASLRHVAHHRRHGRPLRRRLSISNHFTQALLYGDSVDLPERYNFNHDVRTADRSDTSLLNLRDVDSDGDGGMESARGPNHCPRRTRQRAGRRL